MAATDRSTAPAQQALLSSHAQETIRNGRSSCSHKKQGRKRCKLANDSIPGSNGRRARKGMHPQSGTQLQKLTFKNFASIFRAFLSPCESDLRTYTHSPTDTFSSVTPSLLPMLLLISCGAGAVVLMSTSCSQEKDGEVLRILSHARAVRLSSTCHERMSSEFFSCVSALSPPDSLASLLRRQKD